jgi:hypothetical protein
MMLVFSYCSPEQESKKRDLKTTLNYLVHMLLTCLDKSIEKLYF